jgi:hypothetical protein
LANPSPEVGRTFEALGREYLALSPSTTRNPYLYVVSATNTALRFAEAVNMERRQEQSDVLSIVRDTTG